MLSFAVNFVFDLGFGRVVGCFVLFVMGFVAYLGFGFDRYRLNDLCSLGLVGWICC